jgi:hypothetical protein
VRGAERRESQRKLVTRQHHLFIWSCDPARRKSQPKSLRPIVIFTTSDRSDRFLSNMSICSLPPAVICAENIALLYLLHSVPVPPSRNEISQSPIRQGTYSLSFARERILASTLAFLSGRNDPNHVTALCIEDNPELASLNVVLAVNRARWEDGNEVLQDLKQSLEKIFAVLSEISEGVSS